MIYIYIYMINISDNIYIYDIDGFYWNLNGC